MTKDDDIPTLQFLESCRAVVPFFGLFYTLDSLFFSLLVRHASISLTHVHQPCHLHADTLSSTAFAPVKADINGNIEVHVHVHDIVL